MFQQVPRRERELLEALAVQSPATAAELRSRLSNPPSNSAVRSLLSRLERRGFVAHEQVEQTYVYRLVTPEAEVRGQALDGFVSTFFAGSPAQAALALLGRSRPTADEIAALEELLAGAKQRHGD